MAKILVTGATGFIGSAIVEELERRGHEVRKASRSSGDIQVDLTFVEEVEKLPGVDVVINAAGTGDINGPGKDKGEWDELNTGAVENLAERYENVHFIQVSSLAAMGLEGSYYREAEPKPVLPYSRSKKEAEDTVKQNFENYTIIRPGEVFDEENIPGMLGLFSYFRIIPTNGRKTPAIGIAKLAELVAETVEGEIESPVLAAREYKPSGILQDAGRLGSRSYQLTIPNFVIGYLGYTGEILRNIGFRVPGIVRARSIMSYQKVERQEKVDSVLED
ncbi:MAG: NAD-dependent epimerase/dehydratase family protein [Candidatus Aenigmatarchaeota archaeon]